MVEPEALLKEPGSQSMHVKLSPEPFAKRPGSHALHRPTESSQTLPFGHRSINTVTVSSESDKQQDTHSNL